MTAFGDSLIQGYGLPPDEGVTAQLQEWLDAAGADVAVVNAGVSGDTTAGGLARIDWTLADPPDAILVTLGGNDMLRGLDPQEARANLTGILDAARESGAAILLAGVEAPGNYGADYAADFDAIWPDLAEDYDAALLPDWFAPLRAEGMEAGMARYMQADGIHPNAEGVALIVEEIGPMLLKLLEEESGAGD